MPCGDLMSQKLNSAKLEEKHFLRLKLCDFAKTNSVKVTKVIFAKNFQMLICI